MYNGVAMLNGLLHPNDYEGSDKSTEDFPVICYTDGSKMDGRVGFAFVVFRSGVESENFQFRIRDECTVFVAELLCLNFAVKWITEQNSVISEYLICTGSLSSLDSLKCISSSNNIIVEIQKQLKSLRDKKISIDFAFVRGHTGVFGNERADWLAKAATKRKIDIDVNIPKSFYKKITKERMVKSWNQEYLISNKGNITKNFFPTINKRLSCHHFYTNYKLTQFLTGHGNFKSYLNQFNLVPSSFCDCNIGGEENVEHVILLCSNCQVIYSQFDLAIHQNDHQARRRFVEWPQNEIAVVPDFHKRILFSDEAHFWLNGYVNKQNCRIWSEANPQVFVETPLHPEKLNVWCPLWAGGIIGPYFFKNDEGHNVTVNGDRYRAMITNFFIPELNNHDVQELRFQQDGATCHTARATIDLLKDTFDDRLISRFGPVNWPPRSCDLTPLDYFQWGYVKSLVYVDKPQTLDHLEDNIRRVIANIRPQMLEKVFENWTSRLDYIRASCGSHMPEIIFKK
ncbi:transposable element Tc3 transposase [Trichonephila clavipes]|uniref:Transposable element Tc3 transposase n=1 Tax=Trichonephila clavipes TaxID=2585209 RepID=A0A8X7BLE3_TRICX|nr:transposable element Tc3 transposase [Trichonephila clavipes]